MAVRRNLGVSLQEDLGSDTVFRFVEEDHTKALLLVGIRRVV